MFKAIERRYRDRKVQDIMKRRTNIVLRDRTLEREGMDKFLQADIGWRELGLGDRTGIGKGHMGEQLEKEMRDRDEWCVCNIRILFERDLEEGLGIEK